MIYQCFLEESHRQRLFDSPLYRGFGLTRAVNPSIARNCPELEEPANQALLSEYAAMLHLWRNGAPDADPWIGFTSYRHLDKSGTILRDRVALEADFERCEVVGWYFCTCVDTTSGREVSVAAQAECWHPGITATLARVLLQAGERMPLEYLTATTGLFCNYWAMTWANFDDFMRWSSPMVQRCLADPDAFTRSHRRSLGYLVERLFICWYSLRGKRLQNLGPMYRALYQQARPTAAPLALPAEAPSAPTGSDGADSRNRPLNPRTACTSDTGVASGPPARKALRRGASPAVLLDLCRRAVSQYQAGQRAAAEETLRQALKQDPHFPAALHFRGVMLYEAGRPAEAERFFRGAVNAAPTNPSFHNSLAAALQMLERLGEAEASCREALRLAPGDPAALNNLGIVLARQKRDAEAEAGLRQALEAVPNDPDVLTNLTAVLKHQGRLDEAVDCGRRALWLRPDLPEARLNLGNAFLWQGRTDEALRCYDQALDALPEGHPEVPAAHLSRSCLHLQTGRLERGWEEYEWRWVSSKHAKRSFRQPEWDGSDPAGRTVLVYTEQGLGDMIQFIRYARLLKQRGATVIVEALEPLLPLFSTCAGIDRLVEAGTPVPDFDVHAPLMSLPRLLGTTLASIPGQVPYLRADPQRAAGVAARIAEVQELKVGINWRGNPSHAVDHLRSVSLAEFAPLAAVEGVRLYSLQKGPGREELDQWGKRWGLTELVDAELHLPEGAFLDTAAAMANLDLVISIDSAPAHLAGALAVPVWVALSTVVDWRWFMEREDTPWYPSMRLFRQGKLGDWAPVFARMAGELRRLVAAKASPPEAAPRVSVSGTPPGRCRNALVVRRMAMGDVVLAEPVVRALRKAGYEKVFIQSLYPEVFENHPDVHPGAPSGAYDTIGLDGAYEADRSMPAHDMYLAAHRLTLPDDQKVPVLWLSDAERQWGREILGAGRWAALDIGYPTGRAWWPVAAWRPVVDFLHQQGLRVVQIGNYIGDDLAPGPVDLNLLRRTNRRQLMAVIGACDFFVGIDSGPVNIAQALGVPGVGVYDWAKPWCRLAEGSPITPVTCRVREPLNVNEIQRIFRLFCMPSARRGAIEMVSDPEFLPRIRDLVRVHGIEEIVETGTYLGTGSTRVFAETGLPVVSIECNRTFHESAVSNLKAYPNVTLLHGYSLSRAAMAEFVANDRFDGKRIGLLRDVDADARSFYLREIDQGPLAEELLAKSLNDRRQLLFLDSAGGVGWLEFKAVLSRPRKSPVLLVFDDVNHVKHYRSAQRLVQLGYELHVAPGGRWGWAVLGPTQNGAQPADTRPPAGASVHSSAPGKPPSRMTRRGKARNRKRRKKARAR
jgi:ADP-heptose:LPS heptosyltransferase/Flp pilus assembly protein TadD